MFSNTYLEVGERSMTNDTPDTPTDTTGLANGDDDEKLIADLAMPADHQIVWLGLAVAALLLFGSVLWGWAFGDDAPDDVPSVALVDTDDAASRRIEFNVR